MLTCCIVSCLGARVYFKLFLQAFCSPKHLSPSTGLWQKVTLQFVNPTDRAKPSDIVQCQSEFSSQTSDNMERWKAEMGRVREKRGVEERRIDERKSQSQKKEDTGVRNVAESRKVGAKAAGAKPCGQMRNENLHAVCGAKHMFKPKWTKHTIPRPLLQDQMPKKCAPLWLEAQLEVKMNWASFGSSDVEKVHGLVARSTFPCQIDSLVRLIDR